MKTLNQKLTEYKNYLNENNLKHSLQKLKIDEVLNYNREFRKSGKYPYNNDIENFILANEQIDEDLKGFLSMEVYLSQVYLREEKEQIEINNILKEGYSLLTEDIIKQFVEKKDKFLVFGREGLQKAVYFPPEHIGFQPTRNSRKYQDIRYFDKKFFYKMPKAA